MQRATFGNSGEREIERNLRTNLETLYSIKAQIGELSARIHQGARETAIVEKIGQIRQQILQITPPLSGGTAEMERKSWELKVASLRLQLDHLENQVRGETTLKVAQYATVVLALVVFGLFLHTSYLALGAY